MGKFLSEEKAAPVKREDPKKKVFKEAIVEVPASWIPMFAIWGLKFLSTYHGKMKDGAPSGFFYDHTREITNSLIASNLSEVKKVIDEIDYLKFKLSILNIIKKEEKIPD
jgi:hypothetical protein